MAKDKIHDAVKNALINDGWTITKEHFKLEYEEIEVYADLLAERPPIVAEKAQVRIVIEIKTFAGRSFIRELQQVLGQYGIYLEVIELAGLGYELYLAVNEPVYERFFLRAATKQIVERRQIKLVILTLNKRGLCNGSSKRLRSLDSRGAGCLCGPLYKISGV